MFKVNVVLETVASHENAFGIIVVESETPNSFEVMEGFAEYPHEPQKCSFFLTKNNCQVLREFLSGKTNIIDYRSKAILRFVADEELSKEITLSTKLTDFREIKPSGKFGRIKTEWDLLHYMPLRYIDRSNPQSIRDLEVGDWAVVVGRIHNDVKYDYKRDFLKIVVQDVKGDRISATFFRQKWLAKQFETGDEVILYGNYSVYVNKNGGRFPQIANAEINKLGTTKGDMPVIPIYPQKDGDKSWRIQNAVRKMLNNIAWIEDPVPEPILKKYDLISRNQAYRQIHFPNNMAEVNEARKRIAFDDFVRLQVYLLMRKETIKSNGATTKLNRDVVENYVTNLPYRLTSAQQKVISEVFTDLESPAPMLRLIQGDVGSGKTMVAFAAVVKTVASGNQAVIVAPTDILATQLYNNFLNTVGLSEKVNIDSALITGRTATSQRAIIVEDFNNETVDVLFSTHAVFFEKIRLENVGLVVIDEQHKFGVEQRNILIQPNRDGNIPDVLTMSATPIPRTTAQILYGDMDVSIIDEMPEGRKPIITEWIIDRETAWEKVLHEVENGSQAYIVASLVEESETLENIADSETVYREAQEFFKPYKVGLVHGKMGKKDKTEVMSGFKNGDIDILVSTSVIEVGVDVPNATVMVVLNSNRFGIASLHQIRGRVGRGEKQSYCFLVGEATTIEAEERLNALVESNDGFYLADKDLEIRGEGKLFGLNQSGSNELFIANLREHKHILDIAKRVSKGASSSSMLVEEINVLFSDREIKSG